MASKTRYHAAVGAKATSIWHPPLQGTLKLNVDAAFDLNTHRAGGGWILRDHLGFCLGGKLMDLGVVASSLMAEALSIREALSWVKTRDLTTAIQIESDSMTTIQALQRPDMISNF
ncbi:hypothetical protein JCGZ_08684 [Jatropha curcas]|uniref:RNase H type-1 domain-containing protein n=1 Tax=Jatropha curcas TaxID=180498 RepID=A0A067KVW2_JATCU|nr:hypothetical protein JCGZ_08684 [Jatropha curcas]